MALRLPTIVIVGRPNVGKSTLFNRIAGRRIAVVDDAPGITRDRLYAEAAHRGLEFRVVDTGGILFSDEDPLVEQIRVQADVAIAEADVIIFLGDAKEGLHTADWELAEHLRGIGTPILVAINKADSEHRDSDVHEFAALGLGDPHAVSAIHDRGVDHILGLALEGVKTRKRKDKEPVEELRLAIVGRPNVGKSSILNAFSGDQRAIVSDIPGTTRDAIDTAVNYKGKNLRLIDTAGIRRRGKYQGSVEYYMVLRAHKALQRAECALLMVDGLEGLTDGDKRVAKSSHDLGKPLVIAVNKWDLREPPDGCLGMNSALKKDFKRIIHNEIPEVGYAPILFSSALEESGMDGVINAVFRSVESWGARIGTGELNRIVQNAVFEKPLVRKGKAVKIYYATQAEISPPTFILFCADPTMVHFSYVRYLENQIRKAHPMEGTPIRVFLRKRGEKDVD